MAPKYENLQEKYLHQWEEAEINPSRARAVEVAANTIIKNKNKYKEIQSVTGVPWFVVGMIHYRESSFNFKTHLHNGDPLSRRTTHVPRGRPQGEPPFTFEESAADALKMPPHSLHRVKEWNVERICFEVEKYNGWGYHNKGRVSPYLWSGTTLYESGKYVRDGVYDETVRDPQLGTMAILKRLCVVDADIKAAIEGKTADVPASPEIVPDPSTPTPVPVPTPPVVVGTNSDLNPSNPDIIVRPAIRSKTMWNAMIGYATAFFGFLQSGDWRVSLAFIAIGAILTYIIIERLRKDDIIKGKVLGFIFGNKDDK